jgi:hypothetical protein
MLLYKNSIFVTEIMGMYKLEIEKHYGRQLYKGICGELRILGLGQKYLLSDKTHQNKKYEKNQTLF